MIDAWVQRAREGGWGVYVSVRTKEGPRVFLHSSFPDKVDAERMHAFLVKDAPVFILAREAPIATA